MSGADAPAEIGAAFIPSFCKKASMSVWLADSACDFDAIGGITGAEGAPGEVQDVSWGAWTAAKDMRPSLAEGVGVSFADISGLALFWLMGGDERYGSGWGAGGLAGAGASGTGGFDQTADTSGACALLVDFVLDVSVVWILPADFWLFDCTVFGEVGPAGASSVILRPICKPFQGDPCGALCCAERLAIPQR